MKTPVKLVIFSSSKMMIHRYMRSSFQNGNGTSPNSHSDIAELGGYQSTEQPSAMGLWNLQIRTLRIIELSKKYFSVFYCLPE